MLFDSIEFFIFLPITFIIYWIFLAKNLLLQNFFIVIASYIFYGWWDWRFLVLIAFSSMVDYAIGQRLGIEDLPSRRKLLVWSSVAVNLGLLGVFKYYNFFVNSFVDAFSLLGTKLEVSQLNIILPVGISFYTFQTLSYTIDVYKKRLKPTQDIIAFYAFVSFFPQLVAGPVERASNLLPQFYKPRTFDYGKAVDGLRQILWGLFKKILIADNCAVFANFIFGNSADLNGSALALGMFFFTIQIYADFSGYSDIAIGTARLFGFNLRQNFAFPFFSRNLPEVWTRWHISLTTWFRDYLYIPLMLKYKSNKLAATYFLILQFLIIGLWHGANWTFVAWGLIQAVYMLPYSINRKKQKYKGVVAANSALPSLLESFNLIKTFTLICFSLIFFRATSITHAISYVSGMFSLSLFEAPNFPNTQRGLIVLVLIGVFFLIEWAGRRQQYAIERLGHKQPRILRWSFYCLIIFMIGIFMPSIESPFIYFQF